MPTMKVYRSGVVQAPTKRGVESQAYLNVDLVKPAQAVGRTEAIFASPSLAGVARWVRGNGLINNPDIKVRELTVDPSQVRIYSVHAWERVDVVRADAGGAQAYWDSGMTLEEWLPLGLDPREWELLLTPEDINGVRPVSARRVADAEVDDYNRAEILKLLKR